MTNLWIKSLKLLILSDISMHTTDKLVSNIKQRLKNEKFEKDDSQEFFLDLISQL